MAHTAALLTFTANPGKRDDLVAAFQDEAARLADDPGVLLYLVHTTPSEPDTVSLYVAFASEEAEREYTTRGAAGARAMRRADIFAPAPPRHVGFALAGGKGLPGNLTPSPLHRDGEG